MRITPLLIAVLLTTHHASASQAQVVGKLDYTLPAGNSVWTPPFVAEDTFSGRIDSMDYNSSQDEAVITVNTDSLPTLNNHYVELCDGPESGLTLDIISASANSVTVAADPSALGMMPGDKLIIREHLTVASLLPNGANFAGFQDTISIFNDDDTRLDIFWNSIGGFWMDALGTSWDSKVLKPGQGILLFLSEELTISLGGNEKFTHVKTTPTRISASAGTINLVGPVNPFPGTYDLSEIGFVSDFSPFVDSASFFSNDGLFVPSGTYLSNGGISQTGTIFIDGLGNDSSSVQIPYRESTVVSVSSDKTINLAPAVVANN